MIRFNLFTEGKNKKKFKKKRKLIKYKHTTC